MEVRNNFNPVESVAHAAPATPTSNSKTRGGSVAPASTLASDSASLSTGGSLAARALTAPEGSDVRMEKVQAVQQALAEGTYSVAPEAVAGKLIGHMTGSGK